MTKISYKHISHIPCIENYLCVNIEVLSGSLLTLNELDNLTTTS
jgi:hypothetical protein